MVATTELSTRQRIATMCSEIKGVVTPFIEIPRMLQQAQLPASVVFPGRATHDKTELGEQMVLLTRLYRIVLYIENAGLGTSGQGQIEADPFFDSFLQHFAARPGLELDSQGNDQSESAYNAELLSDGGLQVGPYPIAGQGSQEYVQIPFDLQVQEVVSIDYKD